jgi:hypothetical protein
MYFIVLGNKREGRGENCHLYRILLGIPERP